MSKADEVPISEIFGLAFSDPRRALDIISQQSNEGGELDIILLAHFQACANTVILPLARADYPWSASKSELLKVLDHDALEMAKLAITDIARVEKGTISLHFLSKDHFQKDKEGDQIQDRALADAICTVAETLSPTIVQQLRGATKISYLGQQRVTGRGNFYPQEALGDSASIVANQLFSSTELVGSLVSERMLIGNGGRKFLVNRAVRETTIDHIQSVEELTTVGTVLVSDFGYWASRSVEPEQITDEFEIDSGEKWWLLNGEVSTDKSRTEVAESLPPKTLKGEIPAPTPPPETPVFPATKQSFRKVSKRLTLWFVVLGIVGCVSLYLYVHQNGPRPIPAGVARFDKVMITTVLDQPVNVRNAPSRLAASIDSLPPGTQVIAVGRAYDNEEKPWIAVRRKDGSYGFIKERLLSAAYQPQ